MISYAKAPFGDRFIGNKPVVATYKTYKEAVRGMEGLIQRAENLGCFVKSKWIRGVREDATEGEASGESAEFVGYYALIWFEK